MCLFFLFGVSASAKTLDELYQEQLQASGGEELLESLPSGTRELLERLGISQLSPQSFTEQEPHTLLKTIVELAVKAGEGPLRSLTLVFAIVVVQAWAMGLNRSLNDDKNTALFSTVASLAACGAVIVPISRCIAQVGEATESLSVFMVSFAPVYAGVLLTGGNAAVAISFQSMVLYAAQILSVISHTVIVPLMSISLALGLVNSVTPNVRLGNVGTAIGKTATWLLTLGSALFSGLLSLQSLAGAATDTLGNRAVKFSIASFVPLVGGSLSEAFSTVRSCLGVLRSSLGVLGIGACVLMILPPLLSCVVWDMGLSLCGMGAEMFESDALASLLKSAKSVVKCLIAILLAGAMFAVVATTVVTMAVKG